jgi:predicted nucleic acid-binding protein
MIVDTSFILDIIDGVEAAIEKERELEAGSVPLVIPSMTVLELYIAIFPTPMYSSKTVIEGASHW